MGEPAETSRDFTPPTEVYDGETPVRRPLAPLSRDELTGWSRYILGPKLGAGGMGEVYKAWDPRLRRWVALKFLFGRDDKSIKRFLREAEAQAHMRHPSVLEVFETGVVQERHFIAMQFVKGTTLMGIRESTNLEQKLRLMQQIADGVHAAHQQGLVHRDIKPGNVLIDQEEDGTLRPYVMDFGLAAYVAAPGLTATGMVIGTPWYMAPEQLGGASRVLDRRSDVYSLGATFYELLTGDVPFPGKNAVDVLMNLLHKTPRRIRQIDASLPADLEAVIEKCLAKEPRDRYQTARELADDIERLLAGEAVRARPLGWRERSLRRIRRHPLQALAAVATLVAIVGMTAWSFSVQVGSARRAELAHRLGREVRDMEWLMRAAAMSPLHPMTTTEARVRDRMTRLEDQVEALGDMARGPVHYAVGRGYLALGEPRQARSELEKARRLGEDSDGLKAALGLSLAAIYREELAASRRLEPSKAEARRQEIELELRDPAIELLNAANTGALFPETYVDALSAYLQGEEHRAVVLATRAVEETPWLFEGHLLAGNILYARALKHWRDGDGESSIATTEDANRAFVAAARIADSSAQAHMGRCETAGLAMHVALHGVEADTDEIYARAEEACPRATVVAPANADALRLYSDAVRIRGEVLAQRGEDPWAHFDQAAVIAEKALDVSGGGLHFLLSMADLYSNRAHWESNQGVDPRPSCELAIEYFQQAIELDPHDGVAQNNLGQLYRIRSRWEVSQGSDPTETLRLAYDVLWDAVERGSASFYAIFNFRRAALALVEALEARGEPTVTLIEETLAFLRSLPPEKQNDAWPQAIAELESRLR